jgi:hypothetical protein
MDLPQRSDVINACLSTGLIQYIKDQPFAADTLGLVKRQMHGRLHQVAKVFLPGRLKLPPGRTHQHGQYQRTDEQGNDAKQCDLLT